LRTNHSNFAMKLSRSECELVGGWRGDMRGEVIQGWSMWSFYEFRRNRVHLQYAFWCAHKIDFQTSVSHQLSFHTKYVQFHICIYFRFLAVCITLIAKPTCIFGRLYHINSETDMHIFRFSAVNITLIDIFLSTLLHLAGY
jgi:hypothetical protein